MNITRDMLKTIRPQIQAAIKDIGERHGIDLSVGNATFDSISFTFRLKGTVLDAGDGRPAAAAEWDLFRGRFGLGGVEFGDTFHNRSIQYTITGIKPRSRKFPVLAADPSGNVYKFMPDAVLQSMVRGES